MGIIEFFYVEPAEMRCLGRLWTHEYNLQICSGSFASLSLPNSLVCGVCFCGGPGCSCFLTLLFCSCQRQSGPGVQTLPKWIPGLTVSLLTGTGSRLGVWMSQKDR